MITTTPATTSRLLWAGVAAGPLFLVVTLAQAFTRDGFDLSRHPASLLSLGDLGFVQIANFVVTGLLYVVASFAIREASALAVSVAAVGVGMIVAGVFTADPSLGFPPGAPDGVPDTLSTHAMLHGVGFAVAFVAILVANVLFARKTGRRRYVVTGIAAVAIAGAAIATGVGYLFVLAAAVGLGSLSVLLYEGRTDLALR
ncbi:MAG TPA: DUF998 domain-containing protein [Aldersonia sp.]